MAERPKPELRDVPQDNIVQLNQYNVPGGVDVKVISGLSQSHEVNSPSTTSTPEHEDPWLSQAENATPRSPRTHEEEQVAKERREKYAKKLAVPCLLDTNTADAILERLEKAERARDEYKDDCERWKELCDKHREKIIEMRKEIKRLTERNQLFERAQATDDSNSGVLEKENERLRSENLKLTRELRDKESEVATLNDALKQAINARKQGTGNSSGHERLLVALQREVERAREEAKEWQKQATDWEQQAREWDAVRGLFQPDN